jgi:hypothetical protein
MSPVRHRSRELTKRSGGDFSGRGLNFVSDGARAILEGRSQHVARGYAASQGWMSCVVARHRKGGRAGLRLPLPKPATITHGNRP